MADSHNLNRRDFVKVILTFLGTIMGVIIGLPAIGFLISPATETRQTEAWISLGPLENYPIGIPTLFSFTRTVKNGWEKTVSSYGAYVLRKTDGQINVFSNMCTHLSCRVTWNESENEYICPCHDARFAIEGDVTAGPPPEPLHEYEIKIEDSNLLIHFMEG